MLDWIDDLLDALLWSGDAIYDTRVRRNVDKPHRCPRCHDVCYRGDQLHAWTIIKCARCQVWWRYGPTWTIKIGNRWRGYRAARYIKKSAKIVADIERARKKRP